MDDMDGTNGGMRINDLINNQNSNAGGNIYLHGSNAQLILANSATNSLSRNSNYNLYEIRKSKRGGGPNNNYNGGGTIKTATYVSPNGTLSKVNIITPGNEVYGANPTNGMMLSQQHTLQLKQQQINGLNNARNLSNLIGFHANNQQMNGLAQPNEYLPSGRIGAILAAGNSGNDTIGRSGMANSITSNHHYLIPLNSSEIIDQSSAQIDNSNNNANFNLYVKNGDVSNVNSQSIGATVNSTMVSFLCLKWLKYTFIF
jgi:hypothetical protein